MRNLLMMLAITFLSLGCDGFPKIDPEERCILSLEFNKCRCHQYDFDNPPGKRRVSESVDYPVEYCDKGVVFRTNEDGAWLKIANWLDEIYLWLEDRQ